MKTLIRIAFISMLILNLAEGKKLSEDNRDREHSVRGAVQSVTSVEPKALESVSQLRKIFEQSTISGELRSMYSGYTNRVIEDTYATALGGSLKYESGAYKGFNLGTAFITTRDISYLTGSGAKHNEELSSDSGKYTQLSQAYLNYSYNNFNLRIGRQEVDTPLAENDDIRMTPNSFEAYVAMYTYEDFKFSLGKLERFQGFDAGIENRWQETGEDGTYFGGFFYENTLIDMNAWYYNITKLTNASYLDMSIHKDLNKKLFLHAGLQYLDEREIDNSGTEARIYGAFAEMVYDGLGLSIAYNKSLKQKGKTSFSGFGGGALFTSMDKMILDDIIEDRDAQALVGVLSYKLNDKLGLLYAYGDFRGELNSLGAKEHIKEQNIGFEYILKETFTLAGIFTRQEDQARKLANTEHDWDNVRLLLSYNF